MDEGVLADFLAEAADHLDTVERDLLSLEGVRGDAAKTSEMLNRLFRAVHSIKGAAGFLELGPMVELTHCMENIFGGLREKCAVPSADCVDAVFQAMDSLREMIARIECVHEINYQAALGKLHACAAGGDVAGGAYRRAAGIPGAPAVVAAPTAPAGMYYYRIELSAAVPAQTVLLALSSLAELAGSGQQVLYVHSVLEHDLIAAVLAELPVQLTALAAAEYEQGVRRETAGASSPVAAVPEAVPQPRESAALAAPAPAGGGAAGAAGTKAAENSVRVDLGLLEQLMALAGELVLVRNRHQRWMSSGAGAAAADEAGREITQRLDTVTRELQISIMKTRMQPLERVFSKLPRLVREVARQLGKEIELALTGGEIEVDRAILESLADPLTHLLRNSCDHGIETPDRRAAAGKPVQGRVEVRASHENGMILIAIIDDGKGIDPEFIARKAMEKGLVSEGALAGMDARQKLGLIMLPGFSTAEKVSNISGRGVGMDVVKSSVEKLGGTVEIDAVPGRGSRFVLRLPLTLAIIQSLIVAQDGQQYVIPRINLEEVINLVGTEVGERVRVANGQEVLDYHRSFLQLVRLGEVFARPRPFDAVAREEIARRRQRELADFVAGGGIPMLDIAVLRVGERRIGLVVDQTREMEEIVVKPVHPAQKELGIFLGATVTGDGRVAMILDAEGLARHALSEIHYSGRNCADLRAFMPRSDDAQKMLLFESAEHERFAIGLSFIRRIHSVARRDLEEIGEQLYARLGGQPVAVARLDRALRVRPCAACEELYLIMPRYGNKGCGILASRICGIVDVAADFNEAASAEPGVMGVGVVNGATTIFPDIYHVCETAVRGAPAGAEADAAGPAGASAASRAVGTVVPAGQTRRVLLAEDAPFFRQLICTYMRKENIQVDTVANGEEALRLLNLNRYDLLLSDIEMPVMDGRELVRRVKADHRRGGMPVIALTSLDTEEDRQECLHAGFDDYMVKLNRELLLATLRRYLAADCQGGGA